MKPFSMTLNVAFDDPLSMANFLRTLTEAFGSAQAAVEKFMSPAPLPVPQVQLATLPPATEQPASPFSAAEPAAEPVITKPRKVGRPKGVSSVEPASAASADASADSAPVPAAVAAPTVAPQPAADAETPTEITKEALIARSRLYVTKVGAGNAFKKLADLGAARVSDIAPEKYAEAWAAFALPE